MTADAASILVDGRRLGLWQSVQIDRSLDECASSWAVKATRLAPGEQVLVGVRPGSPCEVLLQREVDDYPTTVLTGYVDAVECGDASLTLSGRGMTSDLVDCSVIDHSVFRNVRVEDIASAIAEPYGVEVLAEADTGDRVTRFRIDQGETVYEAISRLAAERGLLVTDNEDGRLVLTRAGATRSKTPLVRGNGGNILTGGGRWDASQRYSEYRVRGQRSSDAQDYGAEVADVTGYSTDDALERRRVLVVRPPKAVNRAGAKAYADWLAATHAGRASTYNYIVQGWRQQDGTIWRPNQIVRVVDPWIGLDADLLVVSVGLSLSPSDGTRTTMGLAPPSAYTPQPQRERAAGTGTGAWISPDKARELAAAARARATGGRR